MGEETAARINNSAAFKADCMMFVVVFLLLTDVL